MSATREDENEEAETTKVDFNEDAAEEKPTTEMDKETDVATSENLQEKTIVSVNENTVSSYCINKVLLLCMKVCRIFNTCII